MTNKSIILLSGGLDSLVSISAAKEEYGVSLALTFDYGQRAAEHEIANSKKIAEYFGIEHRVMKLDWLAEITNTALVNRDSDIPLLLDNELDDLNAANESAKNVWVPNRNGLFLNIAASFADSFGFTHILFGANKEEGTTFPDNTQEFIDRITDSLSYSTLAKPKVVAPLIKLDKKQIIDLGVEVKAPFDLVRSCYSDQDKHCGVCESCKRLKRALIDAGYPQIVEILF